MLAEWATDGIKEIINTAEKKNVILTLVTKWQNWGWFCVIKVLVVIYSLIEQNIYKVTVDNKNTDFAT